MIENEASEWTILPQPLQSVWLLWPNLHELLAENWGLREQMKCEQLALGQEITEFGGLLFLAISPFLYMSWGTVFPKGVQPTWPGWKARQAKSEQLRQPEEGLKRNHAKPKWALKAAKRKVILNLTYIAAALQAWTTRLPHEKSCSVMTVRATWLVTTNPMSCCSSVPSHQQPAAIDQHHSTLIQVVSRDIGLLSEKWYIYWMLKSMVETDHLTMEVSVLFHGKWTLKSQRAMKSHWNRNGTCGKETKILVLVLQTKSDWVVHRITSVEHFVLYILVFKECEMCPGSWKSFSKREAKNWVSCRQIFFFTRTAPLNVSPTGEHRLSWIALVRKCSSVKPNWDLQITQVSKRSSLSSCLKGVLFVHLESRITVSPEGGQGLTYNPQISELNFIMKIQGFSSIINLLFGFEASATLISALHTPYFRHVRVGRWPRDRFYALNRCCDTHITDVHSRTSTTDRLFSMFSGTKFVQLRCLCRKCQGNFWPNNSPGSFKSELPKFAQGGELMIRTGLVELKHPAVWNGNPTVRTHVAMLRCTPLRSLGCNKSWHWQCSLDQTLVLRESELDGGSSR